MAFRLKEKGMVTVFDLCDNHFYVPVKTEFFTERAARLQRMVEAVDHVTVSSTEMGKHIRGKDTIVIDDLIDVPKLRGIDHLRLLMDRLGKDGTVNIVWYGSAGMEEPRFGMIDLQRMIPALEKVNRERKITLNVISNSRELFDRYLGEVSFKTRYHKWERKNFAYKFKQNSICIIPVNENPFTLCKTNNRVAQSLMLGVPVIADVIPSYEEFSDCILFSNWEENLMRYIQDDELRQEHLKRGRAFIEKDYGRDTILRQWSQFFQKINH